MLPGASERFIPIPEGNLGSWETLKRMAAFIRQPDALVDETVARMTRAGWPPARVFRWVQDHVLYYPDFNNGVVIEELYTPGYLLMEIARLGAPIGDCDDMTDLLGAIWTRQGYPVTLEGISRHTDRLLDHVYLYLDGPEGRIAADAIVPHPLGWEVPAQEVTNRVEMPV